MNGVTFERKKVEVELRFTGGKICCEWCNLSYRNRKGHFACGITGEEMLEPGATIGFYCPLRKDEKDGNV